MHGAVRNRRPCKIIAMKAKVTKVGVPIRKEPGKVVVLPAKDPILGLGENPIDDGIMDGSRNHDHYLYGSPKRDS